MLSLCQLDRRYGRREFLRIGGLALGGLSLGDLLAARSSAAPAGKLVTDKSVIFLFLHGGPSQFETFDPKMSAPGRSAQRHGHGRSACDPRRAQRAQSTSGRGRADTRPRDLATLNM
ncbi:MAG TPA: DUF1501 domain-containing protein [Pirellulales bacterium]|nr:DUF1501 domain-containing protein [Pirellulales bacterium]